MADDELELIELDYLRDRALKSMPHGQRHQVSSRDKAASSARHRGDHYPRSRDPRRDFVRVSSSSPSSHSYSTSSSSLRSHSTLSSRSRTPSCSPSRSYSSSVSSSYTSVTTLDSRSYTPPLNRYRRHSLSPPHRISGAHRRSRRMSGSPSYSYTPLLRREREKPAHTVPRRGPRSPREERGRVNRHPLPPSPRDSRLAYSDRPKDRHRYSDEYHSRLPPPPPLPPLRNQLKPLRNRSPPSYRSSLPPPLSSRRSAHSDREYRGETLPNLRQRRDRHSPGSLPVRTRISRGREPPDSRDHSYRSSRHAPPPPPHPTHHDRRPPSPLPPRHSRDRLRLPPHSPRENVRLSHHRSPRESVRLSHHRSPRESVRLSHPAPREHDHVERQDRHDRLVRKVIHRDQDRRRSPEIHRRLPPREHHQRPPEYEHTTSEHAHRSKDSQRPGIDRKRAEYHNRPRARESTRHRPAEVSHEVTERRKRRVTKDTSGEDERPRPTKQARKENIDSVTPPPEDEEVVTVLDDAQQEVEDEVANVSLTNALEATLDEELDYDETMETADLHLIEVEDNIEGSPIADIVTVGDGDNDDDDDDSNECALLQEAIEEKSKDESKSVEIEEGEMKEDELEEGEEVEEGEAVDDDDDDDENEEEGVLLSEGSHVHEDTANLLPDKDHVIDSSSSDETPEPLPSSKPGVVISSPIRVSPERERRHRSSYHSSDEPRQDRDTPSAGKLPVKERLFLSKKDIEHKKRATNYRQEHRLSSNLASRLGPSPFRRQGDGLSSSQRSSWHGSRKSSKGDAIAIAEAYRRQKRKKELMEREEEVRKGQRMAKLLNKTHEQPLQRERRDRRQRAIGGKGKNGMRHGRENDLDRKISKIREKNEAILKRRHEIEKDKKLYS